MPSKKALKKIESIIKYNLPILEQEDNYTRLSSNISMAYASGLSSLINNSSFKEITNKQNRIKNAKIVRAAKTLIIQFENFGVSSFIDLSDNIINGIKLINPSSKLAPLKSSALNCIERKISDYELECSAFYNSLLIDIFNQGRQHQTIANPSSKTTFKKFASYEQKESENFDIIISHLQNELLIYLGYLKEQIENKIEKCYQKGMSKLEIESYLNKNFSKYSFDMQEIFRKHSWQVYSFGNLYQLEKDNVNYVAWKTGHHIDDCLTCRGYQTGELILKDLNNQELPYLKTTDSVMYNIKDILKLAKLDGPSIFCHHDCRCEFISAESKKASY